MDAVKHNAEATMRDYLFILLGTALVNNVVLVRFLGLCPFMGVSNKIDQALGMGMATTFVLTLAVSICWLLERYVLIPFDIQFLRILTFILVIAGLVQFTEMFVRKASPALYQVLGIYLPLITTNCAVFGMALLNIQQPNGLLRKPVVRFRIGSGFHPGADDVRRVCASGWHWLACQRNLRRSADRHLSPPGCWRWPSWDSLVYRPASACHGRKRAARHRITFIRSLLTMIADRKHYDACWASALGALLDLGRPLFAGGEQSPAR
jgi:electron transport complex protein RnfA